MNEFARSALGFLIGCVGLAVIVFAFWGGLALTMHNGASQTCATSGGHWVATDKNVQGGVDRSRECRR